MAYAVRSTGAAGVRFALMVPRLLIAESKLGDQCMLSVNIPLTLEPVAQSDQVHRGDLKNP